MKIMVYDGPKQLRVEEKESLPVGAGEVKIRTICSGISHGTEMNVYRGAAPFFRRKSDPETRLFVDAGAGETWQYPIRSCDPGVWYMGYASVGEVIETGNNVTKVKKGDVVVCSAPHQTEAVKSEDDVVILPDGINPEYAVTFTNLITAYNGIMDTHIILGETVVVSGLGMLGQMVVQMAKMNGASKVYGIDVIERRLEAALENGCDEVFSPMKTKDIAKEIRKRTNNRGADKVIEVTGNAKALQEALRSAAPETTITALGWYQGKLNDVDLSEEFHHNRLGIKQSQTNFVDPSLRHLWDYNRRVETCLDIMKKLKFSNLITHRMPYNNVAEAYQIVDQHPEDVIQVVITYEEG